MSGSSSSKTFMADDPKNVRMNNLIKNPYVLILLATLSILSFSKFWMEKTRNFFSNIFPIIKKKTKCTPKNQKIKNRAQTHTLYVHVGPKRYLDRRDPIIGSMGLGGGEGLNWKVRVWTLIPQISIYVNTVRSKKQFLVDL